MIQYVPFFFFFLVLLFSRAATKTNNNITLPGCPSKCGNLTVPYPFGIVSTTADSTCSIGPWFDITCNTSFNPPKAFLPADLLTYTGINGINRVEVLDISDEHVRVKNTVASKCYNQTGGVISGTATGLVVQYSYYTLSELNKLVTIGCDEYAIIAPVAGIEGKNFTSGCALFAPTFKMFPSVHVQVLIPSFNKSTRTNGTYTNEPCSCSLV